MDITVQVKEMISTAEPYADVATYGLGWVGDDGGDGVVNGMNKHS